MAKELALHQSMRKRSTIDSYHRLIFSIASRVNRSGDQLFAGTCFTTNQPVVLVGATRATSAITCRNLLHRFWSAVLGRLGSLLARAAMDPVPTEIGRASTGAVPLKLEHPGIRKSIQNA